jgi:hypothetical protein
MTRTNCQTTAVVRLAIRARGKAVGPSSARATTGVTTQAAAAIGRAAAAQIQVICEREYCGICTSGRTPTRWSVTTCPDLWVVLMAAPSVVGRTLCRGR